MKYISVCMATYNGGQFIDRQLRSILPQLNETDEVIISDDGSKDDTLSIIHHLDDPRIRVVHNIGRRGPVGNFEHALRQATGKFIFFADQDDIWQPDKVSTTVRLLENNELVLANCQIIDQHGTVLWPSFFNYRGSRRGFWHNLYRNSYIGCCMAFRREVLEYVLPFPAHIHMHDWWIGLLVELKGRIAFCEKPLMQYVRHGQNASPTGETGYPFSQRISNRFSLLLNVIKRLLV